MILPTFHLIFILLASYYPQSRRAGYTTKPSLMGFQPGSLRPPFVRQSSNRMSSRWCLSALSLLPIASPENSYGSHVFILRSFGSSVGYFFSCSYASFFHSKARFFPQPIICSFPTRSLPAEVSSLIP